MPIVTFEDWNESFLQTGLPFELLGQVQGKTLEDEPFADMGEAKLRIKNFESVNASKIVHALYFPNLKYLRFTLPQSVDKFFILSPSIPPRVAELLREQGFMFADQRGNGFASWPGVHIDVRGKTSTDSSKKIKRRTPDRRTASLFTPRRAQVSGALLAQPAILRSPIREIADSASVSVGTAIQTLELLTEAGYLRKIESGYRLMKGDALLDSWAHAYPTGLGLSQQTFRGNGDLNRFKNIEPLGWISGEQAVPKLISGGNTAHIYVNDDSDDKATNKIIQQGRLRRDDTEGQVLVRRAFWRQSKKHNESYHKRNLSLAFPTPFNMWPIAPLPVIYADLLSVGDPRLSEVAYIIKTQIQEYTDHDEFTERGHYFSS